MYRNDWAMDGESQREREREREKETAAQALPAAVSWILAECPLQLCSHTNATSKLRLGDSFIKDSFDENLHGN
jgi:hypothetical protein